MNESLSLLSQKRLSSLRLRLLGMVLVVAAMLVVRWYVYYRAEVILPIAGLYALELGAVWLLLRRLQVKPAGRAHFLIHFTGQLQVVAELCLLSAAVYLTGGIISPLIPVYFVYIFGDGLISKPRTLILHVLLATGLMLFVTLATFYGWLERWNIGLVPETQQWRDQVYVDAALGVFVALMLLTLIVAITFSRRSAQREKELGESAAELAMRVEQLNTLREIGQHLASSLELGQVLEVVGASALKMVNANDVHIFPYDPDAQQFLQGVGLWSDGHRAAAQLAPPLDRVATRVAENKALVIIQDVDSDLNMQSLIARASGLKSIASFPIIKSDRLLAVMNVASMELHRFSLEEQQALAALADQAAVAIDNALLYQQIQRKIQELSALNQVTQSAAQLTDIPTMLNDVLGAVLAAVRADGALVATYDPVKSELDLAAHRGVSTVALNEFKAAPLKAGEGFAGRVVQSGKPLFVLDSSADPRRVRKSTLDAFVSIYSVPLRAYDQTIGVLQLLWKEQHQITPTEISLSGAIVPQLAVAMHNSMLYSETKRRAEELATLRSIGLATTSTLNLREQLRLLYENVNQLLKADTFFVGLYDETRDELRVEYVVEEGWFLRPLQVPLDEAGLSGWVIRNQKPLRLDDLERPEAAPAPPQHVTRPARSWLGVPLMLKERIVGVLSAQSFQPNAFTVADERFLVSVGQHVALALDNARLFGESERRTRELTLLNEISRAISASLDLDVILDRAAHALSDQLGYRHVSIYSFEGDQLVCKASIGDKAAAGEVWHTTQGVIGRVARTGRPVFLASIKNDTDYVAVHEDTVSEICVPILREGRVLGIVNVEETTAGALKDDDLALLSVLSEQLAIAATNAALYREALGRERFSTRLGQLGMTVTATLDLVQLIEVLCRESLTLFAVDTAAIYMRETVRVVKEEGYVVRGGSLSDNGAVGREGQGERARLVCRAAAGWGRQALLGTVVEVDQLGNLFARTLRLARGSILHDALASPQLALEAREAMQPQACLAVPIIKERDVIGVLVLSDRQDAARFGEPEMARAAIVASQAGLAISNARLYQESQRRAREQSSLYEIGLAVSSTLDLKEQLRIIYEQITKHFGLAGFDIALREDHDQLNFALFVDEGQILEPFSKPLSEAGFAGWVVTSRRPLVIDDILRQWDSLPVKPGEHGAPPQNASYIGIPLIVKSEAMGVMALQRSPVEPFTPDEQRFLFALAQQVAFAVDNARLHQQSQRSIAQQSMLYQASRRIAGALSLDMLFKAIVDALSQDFGYRGVLVTLFDRETNELRPAATSPDLQDDPGSPIYHQVVSKGLMGMAAQTGSTQLTNDVSKDEPHLVGLLPSQSQVAVPIKSGANVIGILNVESEARNAFALDDVRMFEAIADQLAVAVENAKLFSSAQERLARINALQTIEVAILSTMNLTDRLDLILEHAVTQMRADLGVVYIRDPQTRELFGIRQRGARHLGALRELRVKMGEGAAGWVLEHGEPLYLPDVKHDPRWSARQAFDTEGIISYLGVPLKVESRTIGVIDVSTRSSRLFTDEEINFFNTLASHAAVAIENARLYEQVSAQLEQLRNTQDRLVESERRAAIGELVAGLAHEINNPLTAIMGHSQLLLETVPEEPATGPWRGELDTISNAAQRIARIVQEFIKLSHVETGHAETVNLSSLLHTVVEKFGARDNAQDIAILETLPAEPLIVRGNPILLDQVIESILLNSAEAMPHGGRIDVQAGALSNQMVFCSIRDTGYGIPAADLKRVFEPGYTTKVELGVVRGIGLGLYTAERIVKSHGGTISLESEEGKFTVVTIALPGQKGVPSDAN